jgi:hypothetical protein
VETLYSHKPPFFSPAHLSKKQNCGILNRCERIGRLHGFLTFFKNPLTLVLAIVHIYDQIMIPHG